MAELSHKAWRTRRLPELDPGIAPAPQRRDLLPLGQVPSAEDIKQRI